MKRILALLPLLILCFSHSFAQEEYVHYEPTEADYAYRELRAKPSIPPYGLDKVKGLIKKVTFAPSEEGDAGISALSASQYDGLSLREKFTYTMIHPEAYSQNCAIFIYSKDEHKLIYSYLISWMDETTWSKRQVNFLRDNRDSVMQIIQESVNRSKRMGVNYKDAVVEINAWEMIPYLINYYKTNKQDVDVLTTLLLLMKQGEYAPFLQSASYSKLYGSDYNYERYINLNQANEELIVQRAMGYYGDKIANK
ncbi:hypothetical protein [Sphingobacterium hungaricum]